MHRLHRREEDSNAAVHPQRAIDEDEQDAKKSNRVPVYCHMPVNTHTREHIIYGISC